MANHLKRRQVLSALGSGLLSGFVPYSGHAANSRQPLGYLRTNWSRDPFSLGSYSYFAKGSGQRDVLALEKPLGTRVFFAGEATFPKHNSTVHAAYESGQRAALKALQQSHGRIAIIGAGMSGLAAAHHLSTKGLDVTVFEARDRIGGRVHTDRSLGFAADLGGSWIHGIEGNPLTELADDLGLKRVATDDDYIVRGNQGRKLGLLSTPDWLESVSEIQHGFGADADLLDEEAYEEVDDYPGYDVKFPNGYSEIFEALEGDYTVELSSTVTHVSHRAGAVKLNFANRTAASFDAVIVTLPLGVLKSGAIMFDPAMPAEKANAIERLGMGLLDKLYLQFDRPFWDADVTWILTVENGFPPGHFNQWLNLHKYFGVPVLLAFNGGSPALELAELDDEDLVQRGMQTLNRAYPGG